MFRRTMLLSFILASPAPVMYYIGVINIEYWAVYFVLVISIYLLPRFIKGLDPAFYYWKIYVEYIYKTFKIPVRYSVLSLLISTIFVTGGIWYLTNPEGQDWLIVITAFYASILLFREVFFDFPLVKMGGIRQAYDVYEETLFLETTIGNIGSMTVTDPNLDYQVYDGSGEPVANSERATIPGKNRSLDPGEWTEEESIRIEIDLTDVPKELDGFYLHTRAYSGHGYSLLADNRVRRCTWREDGFIDIEQ